MKKLLFSVLLLMGFQPLVKADSKLTALTADTTAQAADIIYKVDSPGGTPVSRSITLGNLMGQVAVSSLNVTGVTAGSYGSGTQVPNYTVGADGRLSAAANTTISLTNSNLQSGTYSNVTVPAANVASGSLGANVIGSSLAVNGVSAGTYGSATQVSSVTIGSDGRITGAANVTISLTNSNLQSGTYSNVTVPAANVAAGSLGSSVLASSFPVSGVTSGSYTNTNLTVNAQGIITTASNGTSSGGGYAVEPATVPFKLNQGFSTAGATFTALSPGVMHIVAVSSVVATGLVSMSTETAGAFISSVNVSAALTVTNNGLNNTAITLSANSSSTTLQGNAFNGASQLIQATAATKYPAIDGSLITNIPQLASTQTWTGGNTYTSSSTWTSTMSATGMSAFMFGQTTLVDVTNNIFQVGSSTTMAYTKTGHLEFHASTSPTVSSCGVGANVTSGSTDVTGTLTMGSLTVGCTLTFSQAWKNTPQCFGNDETGVNAVKFAPTVNNVVITTAGSGGDVVDWFCVGEQ